MLKEVKVVNIIRPELLILLIVLYISIVAGGYSPALKKEGFNSPVFSKEVICEQEETVAFTKMRVLDFEERLGTVRELQKGADGMVKKKYQVHYENGYETGRQLIEETILQQMQPEITTIGVKDIVLLASRELNSYKAVLELESTAYTHTGDPTFTGVYPQIGTIAVDPRVIPLGTKMWIEGYGYGVAQDTGGLIKGNIIDLFMDTKKECWDWGRRKVKVYVLN